MEELVMASNLIAAHPAELGCIPGSLEVSWFSEKPPAMICAGMKYETCELSQKQSQCTESHN
jgi:hypothetical protein